MFVVVIGMRSVAVLAMDVIHVVTVLDRFVATVGPVLVSGVILRGGMQIGGIALVVVAGVLVVDMSVVEVVQVVAVLHRSVTAGGPMAVRMVGVNRVGHLSAPVRVLLRLRRCGRHA